MFFCHLTDTNAPGDLDDFSILNTVVTFPCTPALEESIEGSTTVLSIINDDDYEGFEDLEISINETNLGVSFSNERITFTISDTEGMYMV